MSKSRLLALLLIGGLALVFFYPRQAQQASSELLSTNLVGQSASLLPDTSTSHRILGRPTVTAAWIDRVLTLAHSPATGIGQVMYQTGVQDGIDPVYALAFFHHESSYGLTGVARTTLSIGNIRCTPGYTCYQGYRSYPSYAASTQDWYKLLQTVYLAHGLDTVEKIIPVYAPASDNNNEAAYIASVNSDVAHWRSGQVQA